MVGKVFFVDNNGGEELFECVLMLGYNDVYDQDDSFLDGRIAGDVLDGIRNVITVLKGLSMDELIREDTENYPEYAKQPGDETGFKNEFNEYLYSWLKVLNLAEAYPHSRISLG